MIWDVAVAIRPDDTIIPSDHPDAAAGFVVMEATEYPVMSGGNVISVAHVLLHTGMIPMVEPVTKFNLESPACLIAIECECVAGRIGPIRFTNQPAFVYHLSVPVEVPGISTVVADIAFGGMTYVMVRAESVGLELVPSEAREICLLGERIKAAAVEQYPVVHPENPEFPGITQTLFGGPLSRSGPRLQSRNAVVVKPGRLDRCPCGTGTSARLAVMHARGEMRAGDTLIHRSIIGTTFLSEIVAETRVGDYAAIIPAISGRAWITHVAEQIVESDDPFPVGFLLGDVGFPIELGQIHD